MGTKQLVAAKLAAYITALVLVLQFSLASPSECSAMEFGFLVQNFVQQADDAQELPRKADANDQDADASNDYFDDNLDLGSQQSTEERLLPPVEAGRFRLPPLRAETIATNQIGNGKTPDSFRQNQEINEMPLPESGSERGQPWNWSVVQWEAPNAFSYPLYFEDRMLERHGQVRFGHLQPVASGARFFATIPMLPYLITLKSPCDCEYKLGEYRSGSCAPVMIQRPPLERSAVVAEAIAIGAGIAILP